MVPSMLSLEHTILSSLVNLTQEPAGSFKRHRGDHWTGIPSLKKQKTETWTWPGPGDSQEGLLPTRLTRLTWVLATTAPLDEADDEQYQHQKGDGAHEPNEPSLGGNVRLVVGVSWWGGPEANP